jgi:superfamily I DNA/RNA helicase
MTVHQAKGKEFDAVVIADGFRRFYGDDDEGRNLFYVALTRGTKRWTVIAPDDDAQASPLLRQLQ